MGRQRRDREGRQGLMDPSADQHQFLQLAGQDPPPRPPEPRSLWNNRAWELEHLHGLSVPQASTINHDEAG
jgi:hypothetical protein